MREVVLRGFRRGLAAVSIVSAAPRTRLRRSLLLGAASAAALFWSTGGARPQLAQATPAASLPPSSRNWERILPAATNLAADGREARAAGKPILLFFSLTGCAFCRGALREAIVPMYRDPNWNTRILFRQVTIDHDTPLTDFDGRSVRPIDLATRLDGRFTPTVMMLDPAGKKIGDAVVGVANFDFYASTVEAMANHALEAMARRGKI